MKVEQLVDMLLEASADGHALFPTEMLRITSAELDGRRLTVAGYVFSKDFPEIEERLGIEGAMGMSYELADAHVADMRAPVWTLTRATFTGAAILLREKAAYRGTSFRLGGIAATKRSAATRVAGARCS